MIDPVENVYIDKRTKDFLITLKRRTKIQNWNTLCRWGFLLSLSLPDIPNKYTPQNDGAIEMTWKIFAGPYSNILWGLLKNRLLNDNIELSEASLKEHLRRHINRGIQAMINLDLKDSIDLVQQTIRIY